MGPKSKPLAATLWLKTVTSLAFGFKANDGSEESTCVRSRPLNPLLL